MATSKHFMKMTPEGSREILNFLGLQRDFGDMKEVNLDPRGRPIFTEDHRVPDDGFLEETTRMRDKLMANSTMEKNLVIAKFLEGAAIVQRASKLEDFEALAENRYDPVQQIIRVWYRNDGLGPDVQLCDQNRVDIQTLYDDLLKRQDGKFLLLRTISKAVNGAWLEVVVEDQSGKNTAILQLKNFTPAKYSLAVKEGNYGTGDAWFDLLPQGSYIAVKNAFASVAGGIKLGAAVMICCNNPADVVLLPPKTINGLFPGLDWEGLDPEVSFWSSAGDTDAKIMETLNRNGNTAFVHKRYTDALRWYDLSQEYAVGEDNLINIWSNKAAAFLGLGCFLRALEFCDQVLLSDSKHVKAIFRKVKALIGVGRSGEAAKFLKDKLSSEQSLMENKDLLGLGNKIPQPGYPAAGKAKMHVTQEEWDKLKGSKGTEKDFEPEYVGTIECRSVSSTTCRRVLATEDIPPGLLITWHRCFADVVDSNDDPMNKELTEDELIGIIANKVTFSPDLGKDIYKLWAGKKLKFLNETDASQNVKVDMARIRKIVLKNVTFVPGRSAAFVSAIGAQINHSCVDTNVKGTYDNSCFKVRASKPIKKGEQLVIRWCRPDKRLEIRKLQLSKFGFTCNCRLCHYEERRDVETSNKFYNICCRMKLLDEMASSFIRKGSVKRMLIVNAGISIISQLEELFMDAPDLNMMLIDPTIRTLLCNTMLQIGSYQHLVALAAKIFAVAEAAGESATAIQAAGNAMQGYLFLKMKVQAMEWLEKAGQCSAAGRVSVVWNDKQIRQMRECGIDISNLLKNEFQM